VHFAGLRSESSTSRTRSKRSYFKVKIIILVKQHAKTYTAILEIKRLGTDHKRRPHKIAKNWPPSLLFAKYLHWLHPPCPCGHIINFKKCKLFAPNSADIRIWRTPLSEKCPNWTISLLRTTFMDSPLVSILSSQIISCKFHADFMKVPCVLLTFQL